jgi:hypothetical protein
VGEIHRLPEKKPDPISEEQEEREYLEAQRSAAAASARAESTTSAEAAEETESAEAPARKHLTNRKPRAELRSQVGYPFKCLPDLWIEKLQGTRYIATWKLAAHLLELDWKQYRKPFLEGEPIILSNDWLKANNLSRHGKCDGLREMMELGLILVQFRPRKSPLVTLVRPPPAETRGE